MRAWLIDIREKQKLTQDQVAESSKIERSYYSMIEGGKRRPSVDVAMKIGHTLGFDWTLFFTKGSNETIRKQQEVTK